MKLKMKFKDPMNVSNGNNNDQIKMTILAPQYFTSKETGEAVDVDLMEPLAGSVATQLPEGVDEVELRGSASVGSKSTVAITVCQILFQISMKGSINQMMTLIFNL